MNGSKMIEVVSLGRAFGHLQAVKGISFEVKEGEVFGFLGPNGAGKTTTINMLCTLLHPSAGQAKVNGFDVVHQRSDVRRSIGLVFQQTTLDEYLNAEQNLRFHGYAYGMPGALREERIHDLLRMVELEDRAKGNVRAFSGGMKRRLEIARGLLHQPRVLFLDEPTLGLDPQTRHHIRDYLHQLRQRDGLTIFLTTHYMDEAENCNRIAVIDHGQIVALDSPNRLKDSIGGDVVSVAAPDTAAARAYIEQTYKAEVKEEDGTLSFHVPVAETFLPDFVVHFPQRLTSIGVRRPTLEDVFLSLTGHAIRDEELDAKAMLLQGMGRWRG